MMKKEKKERIIKHTQTYAHTHKHTHTDKWKHINTYTNKETETPLYTNLCCVVSFPSLSLSSEVRSQTVTPTK